MSDRPYVLLSCAMSIDGYIDDATATRLLLSNDADFDRVDEVRASVDAILVGAGTIRRDNPRLLVRSAARRQARIARGRPGSPLRATITGSGELDPSSAFFTAGDTARIIYCQDGVPERVGGRFVGIAELVSAGRPVDPYRILADLAGRGVSRLMVEGGSGTHTLFLSHGLVDELQLVVAPFLVGDSRAPRLVHDASFPFSSDRRLRLLESTVVGDCALLRYAP